MYSLFDSSLNLLNNLTNQMELKDSKDSKNSKDSKESFSLDISSNFIDKTNEFFTPYKTVLTILFVLLIIIYIMISSNMIGFSKMNFYIHLIYSLVLIYIFLLLIT